MSSLKSPLAQAIDRELADLAAAVYDNSLQVVGRWQRVADPALKFIPNGMGPTSRPDPTSGFKAAVYRRDDGMHCLAFCGSEREARDWLTNLAQGVGIATSQYGQATTFAAECKVQYGDSLVLTGHSLGGGLAAIAAAVTNTPAVTFNPAGVHRNTLIRAGVDPEGFLQAAEAGLVRKYVVKGEILSLVNGLPLVPKAPGALIQLEDPKRAWTLGKHSMATVVRSLDAAGTAHARVDVGSLPFSSPQLQAAALAFRKGVPQHEAVRSHPMLEAAYKALEHTEKLTAGFNADARGKVVNAMRERLAGQIERGEPIGTARRTAPQITEVLER